MLHPPPIGLALAGLAPSIRRSGRTRLCHALALALAVALTAGMPARAQEPLEGALQRLERLAGHEPAATQRELDALLRASPQLDEGAALRVELIRALVADAQYRSTEVLRIYAGVRERARRLDDPRMLAPLEHVRASADYQLGRYDDEWLALQEELLQAERAADEDLLALALVNRVRYFIHRDDYQAAAAAIADAARRAHADSTRAEVAFSDALLAKNISDWERALHAYEEARVEFESVGDRTGVADALAGSGTAQRELGNPDKAIEPLRESIRIYRGVDDKVGEAVATMHLALVYDQMNEAPSALATIAEAVRALRESDEPWQLAQARVDQAALLVRARRATEALALIDQARPVVLAQSDLNARAHLHDVAAQVYAALGRIGAAYEELRLGQDVERRRTGQLVARQLAAQRGRLESERLQRENALLRSQAQSSRYALDESQRAERFERIALVLGATIVLGALGALWRQRNLLRRIARLAEIDGLTGVLNRRIFLESGQRAMNRCHRDGRACALLMIDVDRFKEINDRHGHAVGDRALCAVAAALKQCLRPEDTMGRYGGEEFTVLLPGANAAEAGVIAERLRGAAAALQPIWAKGAAPLTISGGIAIAAGETDDLNELLARADRALYRAKDAGRNRIEFETLPGALAAA
jgi:diguanylate cyclase (GGDEF)-like protein